MNEITELRTQKKIIKRYKRLLKVILLTIDKEFKGLDVYLIDILMINRLCKKINKLIDDFYIEQMSMILLEININIGRNYLFLGDLADIELTKPTRELINKILINKNTGYSLLHEIKKNKIALKKGIKSKIMRNIITDRSMQSVNRDIRDLVYNKVYGRTVGDAAKVLRTFRTEYTRTRTLAKLYASEELQKQGFKVVKTWDYTYESRRPRPRHLAANGMMADEKGYFTFYSEGHGNVKTQGPGLFGIASEDINCRCDTEYLVIDGPIL